MPKYTIDVTDDQQVEIDVAPGAPVLTHVMFEFDVDSVDELDAMCAELGTDGVRGGFIQVANGVRLRHGLSIRRDGLPCGTASIRLWQRERPRQLAGV